MYIWIGVGLLLVALVLALAQKVAPNSEMMVSFKENGLKKFLIGLSICSSMFFGYGVYHLANSELPFIDVSINGEKQTIFGNMGNLGYYSDTLIKKEEKTKLSLVLWKEAKLKNANIVLTYPSGKEEVWKPGIAKIESEDLQKVKEEFDIEEVYELSPYSFKESGKVKVMLKNGETVVGDMKIEVKEK